MGYYDPYNQPDPEEERRKLEEMHRFAYGGDAPLPPELTPSPAPQQPIRAALESVQPPGQLDADAPPEPDAERAAPILEGRTPVASPTPRMLEDDAIRAVRDSYGQKRGFWEDAAPAAIAVGLDALLNKSRGTGAIVGGYAQGVARRDSEDKDKMRQLAQLEIQRSRETALDAERAQNYEINKGNLEARNAELELARQRQLAEQGDPVAKRKLMEAQTNNLESEAYQRWIKDPNAIDAETQARLTQQREMHGEDLADRKAARADSAATRDEMRKAREQQQRIENAAREDKAYQSELNTFRAKTEKTRPQVERMRQIDNILNKPQYAKDIPGVGAGSYVPGWVPDVLRGGEENANDARTMQSARADMADLVGRVRSGAVIPPPEFKKIESFVTAGEHATDEQFKSAYSVYHKMLSTEIAQQASGREKAAREVLGPDTSNYMLGPEYAPPPAAQQYPVPVDPTARLPDDRTTPGPDAVGPALRLGPSARGTSGFPGSAAPSRIYQGPTQPQGSPAITDYLKKLQAEDDDLGVGYR